MIEQALYFGLGFAVAGLMALAFAPVLWARALRLTRQRIEARIPVSMREILADRDHLRAEFAVERRKLEQAVDRARADKGADMGELGRRAAAVLAMAGERDAARADLQAREREIAALSRDVAETAARAGALSLALHHTHDYFERRLDDLTALRRAHEQLEETLEARRATVAGLNTRVMGLEMTIEDAGRARTALERQLAAMKQALTLVSEDRDELATRLETAALAETPAALGESAPAGKDAAPRREATGLESGEAPIGQNDAALRQAIHDLGLAVATMTRDARAVDRAPV